MRPVSASSASPPTPLALLVQAVAGHDLRGVRRALAAGADPNEVGGAPLLTRAIKDGQPEIAKELLKAGSYVCPTVSFPSQSPWHIAIRKDDGALFQQMLVRNPAVATPVSGINAFTQSLEYSPWAVALKNGSLKVLGVLVKEARARSYVLPEALTALAGQELGRNPDGLPLLKAILPLVADPALFLEAAAWGSAHERRLSDALLQPVRSWVVAKSRRLIEGGLQYMKGPGSRHPLGQKEKEVFGLVPPVARPASGTPGRDLAQWRAARTGGSSEYAHEVSLILKDWVRAVVADDPDRWEDVVAGALTHVVSDEARAKIARQAERARDSLGEKSYYYHGISAADYAAYAAKLATSAPRLRM